jgi:hypothetical protein
VLLLGFAACGGDQHAAATDSALSRDLTLAAEATPPVLPQLGDTAATTAAATAPPAPSTVPSTAASTATGVAPTPPRAPTPRPVPPTPAAAQAPPPAAEPTRAASEVVAGTGGAAAGGPEGAAPGPARRAIASGTVLAAATRAAICTQANRPGDRLVATLAADVVGEGGARLPAGTPMLVELATPPAGADFAFRPIAVQVDGRLIPVEGTVAAEGTLSERRVAQGDDKGKVIGGAIAGAILGRVLGGGAKGAVIGAAGGAAAGTIAANRSATSERCLAAGATVTLTLSAPLVLPPGTP